MGIKEVSFKSFNERDMVKGWVYTPLAEPRGIVQIVHGLGEHSRRYLHMILALNDAGFVVCADDHVGHGKTAHDSDTWGDVGNKGYMTTVEDERTLHDLVVADHPDIPFFMFGHSWGSVIARSYAAKYGDDLAGLIICGAPANNKSMLEVVALAQPYIDQGKDSEVVPELIAATFAGVIDRYEGETNPNAWIAADATVVADHGKDPFNNLSAPMNVRLIYDFTTNLQELQGEEWAARIPKELPIYNISGDQDPIGVYGEGTYTITRWLCNTGHRNVTTKVYSNYRHEIHNEPPIRAEVEAGIIEFLDKCLAG